MALLKIHNPELGGILLDISRSRGYIFTYIPHLGDIYKYISPKWGIYVNCMENQDFLTYFEIQKEPSKWDIYCIYGVFSWYIQQYTPSTSAFFRPRPFFAIAWQFAGGRRRPSASSDPPANCQAIAKKGLGRKNASVSGVYCWINPSKTPYIHYI